jgi:hypothetical protein
MKNSNVNYNCTLVNAPLINVNYFIKIIEGVFCKHDKSFKLQSKCNHKIFVIPKLLIRDITMKYLLVQRNCVTHQTFLTDFRRNLPEDFFILKWRLQMKTNFEQIQMESHFQIKFFLQIIENVF